VVAVTARLHLPRRCRRATEPAEIPVQPSRLALLPPVDARIALLEAKFSYVHVTVDPHFEVSDCGWCALDPAELASVAVYGDPVHDDAPMVPLVEERVCLGCALKDQGPIWQAGYESRSDRDIRVELMA
jgi:hypothetical protein